MTLNAPTRTRLLVAATTTAILLGAAVATATTIEPHADAQAETHVDAEIRVSTGSEAPGASHPVDDRATALLRVYVRERTEWGIEPVEGALVVVFSHDCHGERACAMGESAHRYTNANGVAEFRLAIGKYGVHATDGERSGHAKVDLDRNRRVKILIEEEKPDPIKPYPPKPAPDALHALGIRAETCSGGSCKAAAGAQVTIWSGYDDARRAKHGDGVDRPFVIHDPVATGATDENGLFATLMPTGAYRVVVSTGEAKAEVFVKLGADTWSRIVLERPQYGETPVPAHGVAIAYRVLPRLGATIEADVELTASANASASG